MQKKWTKITEQDEITFVNLFARGYKFADISTITGRKYQNVLDHLKSPTYPMAREALKKCGRNYEDGYKRKVRPQKKAEPQVIEEIPEKPQEAPKIEAKQEKLVKGSLDYLEDIGNGFLNFMEVFEKEMGVVLEKQEKDHDLLYSILRRLEMLENATNRKV